MMKSLAEHTAAVAAFLAELAETMGVDLEPEGEKISVAEMCQLILGRARADREAAVVICPLRLQLVDPGSLSCRHQAGTTPASNFGMVEFLFAGRDALDRADALHDALLALIAFVDPARPGPDDHRNRPIERKT